MSHSYWMKLCWRSVHCPGTLLVFTTMTDLPSMQGSQCQRKQTSGVMGFSIGIHLPRGVAQGPLAYSLWGKLRLLAACSWSFSGLMSVTLLYFLITNKNA
jgi:hypothetical protein